jgi:hypothetical protein
VLAFDTAINRSLLLLSIPFNLLLADSKPGNAGWWIAGNAFILCGMTKWVFNA